MLGGLVVWQGLAQGLPVAHAFFPAKVSRAEFATLETAADVFFSELAQLLSLTGDVVGHDACFGVKSLRVLPMPGNGRGVKQWLPVRGAREVAWTCELLWAAC